MVIVRVRFGDWEQFWRQFTTVGADRRREHGSRGVRVFRPVDDPQAATLVFDWDHDAFERFRADPDVQASMRAGGALGPPEVEFVSSAGDLEV